MNLTRALLVLMGLTLLRSAGAEDKVLFSFDSVPGPDLLRTTDTKVARDRPGWLRINTGHDKPWPGITLKAPKGRWDLSRFGRVALPVRNLGTNKVTVHCRVDNPGADGTRHCVTGSLTLAPGQEGVLTTTLKRTSYDKMDGKLFGMRGYPVAAGGDRTVDAANITQILVFVGKPRVDHAFAIGAPRAAGIYTPPTAWTSDASPYFPMIDTFGQYKHKDWPGKVHSPQDLQQRKAREARDLAIHPGPPDRDQYGGWTAGPQLQATGFFRTTKYRGKWWLVDPEGRLFFSQGIDCVRMIDVTPVEQRRHWFEDFPGDQAEFQDFLQYRTPLKGHYAGRRVRCFSFATANLLRKYGSDWKSEAANLAHRRLRSWGMNTIANWSDSAVFLMRRTPYTDNVGSWGVKMIEGSEGYWGKFPDVYDESFAASLKRAMAAKRGRGANDPWCIGYFSDNEMSWGDATSLALAALKSPADQPAKQAFVRDLKMKYGRIEKLNEAWVTSHESWEALLETRETPDLERAREDLVAFYTRTAETYFRTVRDTIQAVAPNQLYLGCRFASVNEQAARAAAKYCDVVSYNLYRRDVSDFKFPGGDMPLIIGEFHFGALDRGLFHTGLVPVENQVARGRAYEDYMLGAARHPLFVGAHWFQWQDEPTTGRAYDGENYQIGFLDIADTPYPETVRASRDVAARLYTIRLDGQ